jgi:hypothetical protein
MMLHFVILSGLFLAAALPLAVPSQLSALPELERKPSNAELPVRDYIEHHQIYDKISSATDEQSSICVQAVPTRDIDESQHEHQLKTNMATSNLQQRTPPWPHPSMAYAPNAQGFHPDALQCSKCKLGHCDQYKSPPFPPFKSTADRLNDLEQEIPGAKEMITNIVSQLKSFSSQVLDQKLKN